MYIYLYMIECIKRLLDQIKNLAGSPINISLYLSNMPKTRTPGGALVMYYIA